MVGNRSQFDNRQSHIFCRTWKIDESWAQRVKVAWFFSRRHTPSNYQLICPILVQGYFLDHLILPRNFSRKIITGLSELSSSLLRESRQPIPFRINTWEWNIQLRSSSSPNHDLPKNQSWIEKKVLNVVHTKWVWEKSPECSWVAFNYSWPEPMKKPLYCCKLPLSTWGKIINENHPLCAAIKLSSSNSLPFGSLDPNMAFEIKEIQ